MSVTYHTNIPHCTFFPVGILLSMNIDLYRRTGVRLVFDANKAENRYEKLKCFHFLDASILQIFFILRREKIIKT